ncbi:MAG: basic secretory family protein, partial [Gemmatimonadales bacterium]
MQSRMRNGRISTALIGLASLATATPPSTRAQDPGDIFHITAAEVSESVVAAVRADLVWAEDRISDMLGPFPDTVSVQIFAHREGFTAALQQAWGIPETACWMVGAADDHSLFLLSPGVCKTEAGEPDPDDDEHRRLLVTHEAVHVYHGQVNPSEDVGLLEDIGWFIEGLATYVSGQLETSHAGRAAEALAESSGPERLADAWSGPYRYGVAGSLVAYVDEQWGRETLRAALEVTTQDQVLALLGTT